MTSKLKLPKQWSHWLRRLNLRPESTRYQRKGQGRWIYLHGRGHHWRIACKWWLPVQEHTFQRGDTYEEHDRWALATIVEIPIPQTFAELEKFVLEVSK